jgi:hypothetical protein
MKVPHILFVALAAGLSGCAGGLPQMLSTSGDAGSSGAEIADLSGGNGAPPLPERRNSPASAVASAQGRGGAAKAAGPSFFAGSLASMFAASTARAASPAPAAPSVPAAPEQVYVEIDPTTVYARLAAHIKACWLNRSHPALADHKFTAAADPGGAAAITLYQKVEGAKLGIASFRIKITKDSGGSVVRSENVKLPETVKAAMLFDIANWAKGGEGCATRSLAATASPKGQSASR